MKKIKILYIQETDWLKRGPHQQHHVLERLSKNTKVVVMDYDLLWKNEPYSIISPRKIRKSPSKTSDACNIFLIRPRIIKAPVLDYLSMIITYSIEIYKVIKTYRPDVVIGAGMLAISLAKFIASQKRIPFFLLTIDKMHTLIPTKFFQLLGFALESRLIKSADHNIVINEQLKAYTIRMGAKNGKVTVIRAGVDLSRFNPDQSVRDVMRKKLGYTEKDRILFFMGWFYRFSGLKEVLEELATNKNNNIKVCLVGKGDLLEVLNSLIKKFSLENEVKIVNWVDYTEIPSYLSVADVCLLPAYRNKTMNEIVPIKLYEYLAMEKPVITTELRGIMSEFGSDSGVLYCANSRKVFKRATDLTNEEIIELGKKGRKFIEENCDWNQLIKMFERVLINPNSVEKDKN
ncbi:MAG: glycosyltransferase [Candidatus Hodarchaeota archaeon]